MKLSIFATCILISFSALSDEISMVTTDWEPYYGKNLKEGGVIAKLAATAFKRSGNNATVKFIPWARALKQVESGESDILLGAYYSEDRAATYVPSKSFYSIDTVLVANKSLGVSTWSTLKDLASYKIGVARGYANSESFDKADFLQKKVANTPTQNLKKLSSNRVDMIVIASGIANYEASKSSIIDLNSVVFLTPPLAKNALHIMGSRKTPGIQKKIRAFDKAIQEMKADGSFDNILKSYGF